MKKNLLSLLTLFIALSLALTFVACKSDNDPPPPDFSDGIYVITHSADAVRTRETTNGSAPNTITTTFYGYELSYVVSQIGSEYAKIYFECEDNYDPPTEITKADVDSGIYSVLARGQQYKDLKRYTNVYDGGTFVRQIVRYLVFLDDNDDEICKAELIWSSITVAGNGWLTIIIGDLTPDPETPEPIRGAISIEHSATDVKTRVSGPTTYYGYELSYVVGKLGIDSYAKIKYKPVESGTFTEISKTQVDSLTYSVIAVSSQRGDVEMYTDVIPPSGSRTQYVRYLVFLDASDAEICTAELFWRTTGTNEADRKDGWLSGTITTP